MSKKYKVISGLDVLRILIGVDLDIMSPMHCINLVNIAHLLKTSRYQVKKYMDMLVNAGVAELALDFVADEYEFCPYWGYRITERVRAESIDDIPKGMNRTYILQVRVMYKKAKVKNDELIDRLFNNR